MPIYAYKCESCGFAKDVLQKISDAPLNQCPACEATTFRKQLTAAGFQLKGSGWYATDFKGGNNGAPASADNKSGDGSESGSQAKPDGKTDAKPEGKSEGKSDGKSATKSDAKAQSTAPAKTDTKAAPVTPTSTGS